IADARAVFDGIQQQALTPSWNVMIAAYAQNGDFLEARRLFDRAPRRDVFTWTTLMHGAAQHEGIASARGIFRLMPGRTAVSWNSMIA
ncbi:hypothetical protein SELMODRAFT_19675, partial [Selaginella moellendorffii]